MEKNKVIAMCVAALLLTACGNNDVNYDASGVFETTEIIVSARGTGEIKQLSIEEGQQVKANEPLGFLDMTQLELKKSQLQSGRRAATSRKLDTSSQLASIRQQISNLQTEKARFEALLKDGAATQRQVDEIGYQISVLQKQMTAVNEQVSTANSSIDGQSAGFDSQIGQVEDQMRQAVIFSPIDGVILSKYAEQGEFASPGRALFKVADVSKMKLRAYITADLLTNVTVGQRVTVYADQGAKGRKAYEGTVSWISSEAEFTPKTIQTRDERSNLVYAVKINVANDGLIKRGMYGDVKF
ncbi:MAG: efflux RND transporter periplasmic adaptor subunit [Bacteroidales bacterium]|nr:efflux RND transporter periplasmic adaptor subunit [Bacteroidales bacterium]